MSVAASLERFVCHFSQYVVNRMLYTISLCKLTNAIPWLPCLFRMAKAVSSTIKPVDSVISGSVNSFNFGMWALPEGFSQFIWSHDVMDGAELDYKQSIWWQGWRCLQFHSANRIDMKAHVQNYSKQLSASIIHSLKPTMYRSWFAMLVRSNHE